MRGMRLLGVLVAVLAAVLLLWPGEGESAPEPGTHAVLFVGNNWDGTADVVDPVTFQKLAHFDVIPDIDERLAEIYANPERLGYYLAIRQLVGEGNDQWADDMFSSHDGRFVFISRPSLADVVGMDLKTKQIVWRFPMEGQRADHMAISPDGKRLLVSDSTANKVHELDTATGKKVGEFASGDSPHESNYSADGKRIFHASIGLVYTPSDQPFADSSKGERYFQIVEAGTNKILKRLDIGKIMAENGYPDMSSAVRPMAIAPDEKTAYLQLSFLHGFVVFDLETDKPRKVVQLPVGTTAPREQYLLDSAHHGLAINPSGTKLCAAGTMSNYAAIVHTDDFSFKTFEGIDKPYWSTNSGDGRYCFVSSSGADKVIVLDYATDAKVAEIPVGDHPQRMRMGVIRSEYVGRSAAGATASLRRSPAALQVLGARVTGGKLALRLQVRRGATGKLTGKVGRRALSLPIPRSGKLIVRVPARRGALLALAYKGDARVLPDTVRLRVGGAAAKLRRTRAVVDSKGRLTLRGTIARRARGFVSVRLAYDGGGTEPRTLRFRAPIRSGRWAVSRLLPTKAARGGGTLTLTYAGGAGLAGAQVAGVLRGR
jgi:YVTN family beta-propeller protein